MFVQLGAQVFVVRASGQQMSVLAPCQVGSVNYRNRRPGIGTTRLLLSPACRLQLRPAQLESRVINKETPREEKTAKERIQWIFSFHHHSASQEG